MPYKTKRLKNKTCVYKKDSNKRVGCTRGPIKKYMAALHANVTESMANFKNFLESTMIKDDGIWNRHGENQWSIEMSTLEGNGFPFPASFNLNGKKINIRKFTPVYTQDEDHEITHWIFKTNKGKSFIVLND